MVSPCSEPKREGQGLPDLFPGEEGGSRALLLPFPHQSLLPTKQKVTACRRPREQWLISLRIYAPTLKTRGNILSALMAPNFSCSIIKYLLTANMVLELRSTNGLRCGPCERRLSETPASQCSVQSCTNPQYLREEAEWSSPPGMLHIQGQFCCGTPAGIQTLAPTGGHHLAEHPQPC